MVIGTTRADAIAKFDKYVAMHKGIAKNINRKNHIMFLTQVIKMDRISDNKGDKLP